MKIWEPKPPGTLWATRGLLQDSFTYYGIRAKTFCWNRKWGCYPETPRVGMQTSSLHSNDLGMI